MLFEPQSVRVGESQLILASASSELTYKVWQHNQPSIVARFLNKMTNAEFQFGDTGMPILVIRSRIDRQRFVVVDGNHRVAAFRHHPDARTRKNSRFTARILKCFNKNVARKMLQLEVEEKENAKPTFLDFAVLMRRSVVANGETAQTGDYQLPDDVVGLMNHFQWLPSSVYGRILKSPDAVYNLFIMVARRFQSGLMAIFTQAEQEDRKKWSAVAGAMRFKVNKFVDLMVKH